MSGKRYNTNAQVDIDLISLLGDFDPICTISEKDSNSISHTIMQTYINV